MATPSSPPVNGSAAGHGWALLDSLGEACVALSAGRRVQYCNAAFAALLGVPLAALVGRPLADALPDFAGSACDQACERALRGRAPQEAYHALGERTFHWRVYPTPRGVVALIADATARRQFEDELVQTVLRDRLLLEQLPAIHWTTDRDLRFTSTSGAALRHLGSAPGEAVGRTLYEFFQTRDADFFPIRMHLRALAGERVRYSQPHAGRHFEAVLEPLRDHAGRPAGVIGLAHDVTELRQAMDEQRRLQVQVLHAQKLESLGLLAGAVAHDFNNLLVGMLTAADLLTRDLEPGSEAHGLAEIIKKAAERASGLSRQMLVYAGKGRPARRPLELSAAVEEGLPLLSAAMPKNVSLVTALAADLPPAEADPGQVQQVLTNLVLNAAQAIGTNEGQVRLATGVEDVDGGRRTAGGDESARRPPSAVHRPLEPPAGRCVYLECSDNGCGMSADVLARVCDPFFTTKGRGRGLGLSSVLGIVRAHGGGLRVASVPGAGTTLRVLLPVAGTAHAAASEEGAAEAPRGRVVLVIDAEPVVRGVAVRALGHLGLQVMSAADGREGLELFRANQEAIGLVLLDMGSSEEGLQTLAALRAVRPDVGVVLTSGSEPRPQPPAALLAKPYTVHALLEVVGRELRSV